MYKIYNMDKIYLPIYYMIYLFYWKMGRPKVSKRYKQTVHKRRLTQVFWSTWEDDQHEKTSIEM